MKISVIITLKEDGYGDDMHYSPNGHKQLAEIYERFLKDQYGKMDIIYD